MITPDREAQILRYYHVEKWRPNTIAVQLGVHHTTVQRVLAQAGFPRPEPAARPSAVDPYVPLIVTTLQRFPRLTAARLYGMARERGYAGSASHFRHRVALLRPRPVAEAYLRLRPLPAEQAQVDWAHCGHLQVGRARRPLMAFVMVLSYSRALYLHFFLDARMSSFLAGHAGAFAAFNGVAKVLLYDNLKSAVLERQDDAIRFHPTLLAFAAHHRYEPRPVAVARGNEKGRVERAIRYVRDAFLAGRTITDLATLNVAAAAWCAGPATERRCPEDPDLTVAAAFAAEQRLLLPLPADAFPPHERSVVRIGKTPYARFDRNDYSVPHTQVQRQLTVLADTDRVRLVDGSTVGRRRAPPQLRPRRADRGPGAPRRPGRPQAGRPPAPGQRCPDPGRARHPRPLGRRRRPRPQPRLDHRRAAAPAPALHGPGTGCRGAGGTGPRRAAPQRRAARARPPARATRAAAGHRRHPARPSAATRRARPPPRPRHLRPPAGVPR